MDQNLQDIMEKKIDEILTKKDEIFQLVDSLDFLSKSPNSFAMGIVIGRLYNSFYYQSRRLLKRNPTEKEFSEFLKTLKERQKEFGEKLNSKK